MVLPGGSRSATPRVRWVNASGALRRHVRNGTAIVLVGLLLAIIIATTLQLIQSS